MIKYILSRVSACLLTLAISVSTNAETVIVSENQSITSDYPDYNYGDNIFRGGLFVGRSNEANGNGFVRFYLKFNLPTLNANTFISSATLTGVYLDEFMPYMNDTFGFYKVDNDSWLANSITWNNQPGYSGNALASFVLDGPRGPMSWDITNVVNQEYQGDGQLSLVFKLIAESDPAPSNSWKYFAKKEYDITEAFKIDYTISASPVPIPAAYWLFGSGLVGLLGVARKRKAV